MTSSLFCADREGTLLDEMWLCLHSTRPWRKIKESLTTGVENFTVFYGEPHCVLRIGPRYFVLGSIFAVAEVIYFAAWPFSKETARWAGFPLRGWTYRRAGGEIDFIGHAIHLLLQVPKVSISFSFSVAFVVRRGSNPQVCLGPHPSRRSPEMTEYILFLKVPNSF